MLSIAHKFIFIHVPKTAGNSIQRVLLPYSEDQMALVAPHQDGVDRFQIQSPNADVTKHSSLQDYKAQLPSELYSSLFKFTCIRNPWDRCVSFYFSPHLGKVEWTVEAFVELIEQRVKPTEHYLQTEGNADPFAEIDAFIRFESLAEDLSVVCARLGITEYELPVANASQHAGYREYYTDTSLIDLVAKKFAQEIDRFGYTF